MEDNSTPISKTALMPIINQVKAEPDPELELEKQLEELGHKTEWKAYKSVIETEIQRLRDVNVIGEHDNVETIGLRTVATQLAREKLEWAIGLVESAVELRTESDST